MRLDQMSKRNGIAITGKCYPVLIVCIHCVLDDGAMGLVSNSKEIVVSVVFCRSPFTGELPTLPKSSPVNGLLRFYRILYEPLQRRVLSRCQKNVS